MTTPGAEIVPFGKYKGQPAQVLLADENYRDWLTSQPWFRERFGNLYQTIINYGAEPQDTPEHNEMQISFLDDQRCLQLARILYPSRTFDRTEIRYRHAADKALHERFTRHLTPEYMDADVLGRTFENKGWDVTYQIDPASLALGLTSMPLCTCPPCEDPLIDTMFPDLATHDDCREQAPCRGGDGGIHGYYQCKHRGHSERFIPTVEWHDHADDMEIANFIRFCGVYGKHCGDRCPWSNNDVAKWLLKDVMDVRWFQPAISGTIHVELKPDLGDDFPTVLRQVTHYDGGSTSDRRCVIVRRHQFERVTWEQVTRMFQASRIVLLDESVLDIPELSP